MVAVLIITLSTEGAGVWDEVFMRSHPVVSGVPIGVIGWGSENWEPFFNQETAAKELRH